MDNVFNIYELLNNSAAVVPRGETHLRKGVLQKPRSIYGCLERLICFSINMNFKWLFGKLVE